MDKIINIYEQAEKKYPDFLKNYISKSLDSFFPLFVKFSRPKIKDSREEIKQKLDYLENNSKQKLGFGYNITWKQKTQSRTKGEITLPDEIYFDAESDFLKFINKVDDYILFQNLQKKIIQQLPEMQEWILKNPLQITRHEKNWDDLLKVCKYFLHEYQADNKLYIRELPIQVHTKFIEGDKKNKSNKAIISSILDSILPAEKINNEYKGINNNNFEKRYYLNYDKTLIRFRILDNELYINGLSDISILPEEFFKLNMKCEKVFIVENLMNLLSFPKNKNSIVIWGKGNRVNTLKSAKWLYNKEIIYWGDIDTWGLHILSSLREHFEDVKSILMTKCIFEKYAKYAVKEVKSNKTNPQNLTTEENELFTYLLSLPSQSNRLEQEHISQEELLILFQKI